MTTIKERPILFSAPMVRAVLEGRKTQTRRVVKQGKDAPAEWYPDVYNKGDEWTFWGQRGGPEGGKCTLPLFKCPYGKPGDRLWVRESWNVFRFSNDGDEHWPTREIPKEDPREDTVRHHYEVDYSATTDQNGPWRPNIHMPRWASRIDLLITDVRVERLQAISEADAIAEGATSRPHCNGFNGTSTGWSMDWSRVGEPSFYGSNGGLLQVSDIALSSARSAFGAYINQLLDRAKWNLKPSNLWDKNPWVWVVEFNQVKP